MLNTNDFLHGVDFTGVNPINAGDLNNLVDLAQPFSDSFTEGKGLVLWTVDVGLDTPNVPNPAATNKWIRYIWIRIPVAGADNKIPKIYGWNNDAANDLVLLKWQQLIVDVEQFQAQIDAINAQINALNAQVLGAISAANAASITANIAVNDAASAQTDADNAQAQATTALANSANAVNTANAANATANDALTAANANKTLAQIVPGTAGQKIKVNDAASSLIYFDEIKQYVKISEFFAPGTDAGNSINGTVARTLNGEDNDAGNLATVAGGMVTLLPGIYKVYGVVPGNAGAGSKHQAYLVDNGSAAKLIRGTSVVATGNGPSISMIIGIITLAVATTLRVDHRCDTATVGGLGKASGFDLEFYTIIEFWKLN